MEKQEIPLGSAPALPPHPPADMLDLFMTRYDYDYNRDGSGSLTTSEGKQGSSADGAGDDGISGAVRNRPIFALDVTGQEKDTTYRVDYVPPQSATDMQKLVDAAYSCEPGSTDTTGTTGGGGVFAREWFTLPGGRRMEPTDISIYKTDYTDKGGDGDIAARPGARATDSQAATLYPGAPAVPYKEDFLTVKSGAKEDDGADIVPKITSEESLQPKKLRSGAPMGSPAPSATAAARYLMTSACPPWVPGTTTTTAGVPQGFPVGDAEDGRGQGGTEYGQYSCESWLYGDTSRAHPSQIPQGFAGSVRADLLQNVFPNSTRNMSNANITGGDGGAQPDDTATLLRRLAGQTKHRAAEGHNAPLALFQGTTGGGNVDETNPIYLSPAEQRKCASRHRLEDEGYVKGMTIYTSDYVDQGRLPELPGNPTGAADPRETNTNARPTVGEMTTGTLTAHTRVAASLRNSHGTMLSNGAIVDKTMSLQGSGKEKVAAMVRAALPPPDVVDMIHREERRLSVDEADPHRRKLR